MTLPTSRERDDWEACWRETLWDLCQDGVWRPLPSFSAEPMMVLSAWNPRGQRLPISVNQARDAVLQAELVAMMLTHVRARGRSPDGSWSEDGWQVPYDSTQAERLLRRHGQLAAWITDAAGARYHWADAGEPLAK